MHKQDVKFSCCSSFRTISDNKSEPRLRSLICALCVSVPQITGRWRGPARMYNTTQYNTVQYNTVQYNTVQYSTMQYSTIQYSTIQYSTMQYSTIQYNTVHYNTVQYNAIQYNTVQYNAIQYNTVQYNTVQYNTTLLSPFGELCLLARHLQKTFNTFNNKTSTQ